MAQIIDDSNLINIKQEGVVLVGGCFDVIHPGHIKFLKLAKKQGKKLVVLLESDKNIAKLKGKNRPLNNQSIRAENLSKLECVDFIVLLKTPKSSKYYYNLVKSLEPDIIAVTKGDGLLSVKKKQAELVGGKVVEVIERDPEHSTTKILNKE